MLQLFDRRYQLSEELGSGGMGTVYRAIDLLTGGTVAMKRIHYSFVNDDAASKKELEILHHSLASEFQTLASLRHPNIITVYDYGLDEAYVPYFTMSLLNKPHIITQNAHAVDFRLRLHWLIQILQALAYLHQNDILHRDIKPSNLLVMNEQEVKLVDFGLATPRNQLSVGLGTLAYMPPEFFKKTTPDVRSDIYALGLVAYELFCGHFPLDTESLGALVSQITEGSIKVPEDHIPMELAKVVMRCVARDPADRYPDVHSVLDALRTVEGCPVPQESIAIRQSFIRGARYTGRVEELGRIRNALQEALIGEGSAWLIAGESGIGKSRFLNEVRTVAQLYSFHVIEGTASHVGSSPYDYIGRALRALMPVTTLTPLEAAILKPIIPNLEQIIDQPIASAPILGAEEHHQRLLKTISAVVARQTSPVLMLLDDLHLQPESLPLIKQLARLTEGREFVLIGSYRSDETVNLHRQLPETQLITLGPLSQSNIRQLITAMLGERYCNKEFVHAVSDYAEGNVFFIVDLLENLAEQVGTLSSIGQMSLQYERLLSPGVIEIAQRRLQRVPADVHRLLHFAAVIGRDLDWGLLNYFDPGSMDDEQWLARCASSAILTSRGQNWQFSHDKIRAGILNALDGQTLAELNRLAAEAIEHTYPQNNDYDARLMHHWRAAGNIDKWRYYLNRVTQNLIDQGFFQRAQELLEGAVAHSSDQDELTSQLLLKLARVVKMQGDPERGIQLAHEALSIAEADQALPEQHTILGLLGSISRERGDLVASEAYHQRALTVARRLDNPIVTAKSLVNMAVMKASLGELDEAVSLFKEGYAIAEAADHRVGMALIASNLGNILKSQGALDAARAYYERSLNISRNNDYVDLEAQALIGLAEIQMRQGDTTGAMQSLDNSIALSRDMGNNYRLAVSYVQMGLLKAREPDGDADTILRQALQLSQNQRIVPISLLALIGLAQYELHHNNATIAAEIAAFVQSDGRMMAFNQYHLDTLIADVAATLDQTTLDAAYERGRQRTLADWEDRYLR